MLYHRGCPRKRTLWWRWHIIGPDRRRDRRDAYTAEILDECDEDLKRLGFANEIRVRQKLSDFMDLWRSGSRVGEFSNGFDYKELEGRESKALGIRQIRAGRDYRAAFVIVEDEDPRIVFLTVYIKSRQPDGIRLAVRRASEYFEGDE